MKCHASFSPKYKKNIWSTVLHATGYIFLALLSGHMKVRVHDEAYVRVHLGVLDLNLDFLVARVCFKGGTEYSINILKVSILVKQCLH